MNLPHVRLLLQQGSIHLELSLHAFTEARKDGLTAEDLEAAVMSGELIEDYGERALLLHFVPNYQIPFHIVLEFVAGDDIATIITAYIPDRTKWDTDWKTRKKTGDIKKSR